MEGPQLTVLILAGVLILCSISPVGGQEDDNDDERFKSNDGDYECFYDVGILNDYRYLGAMYCKYGCCGRTSKQRCCTEEEKEAKQHILSGTMIILAITFGAIIAIIIVAVVIYCCCKDKVEKNKAKYSSDADQPKRSELSTVMEMGFTETRSSRPPDSVIYPGENGMNTLEQYDVPPQYTRSDQMDQPSTSTQMDQPSTFTQMDQPSTSTQMDQPSTSTE